MDDLRFPYLHFNVPQKYKQNIKTNKIFNRKAEIRL